LELRNWLLEAGLEPKVLESLPGSTPDLAVLLAVGEKFKTNH
jgi:hypothetical protein